MKQHAPSTERNRAPLLAELARVLPAQARVLELASGSGQHALAFASAHPGWHWHPSDPDPTARASINAYRDEAGLPNLAQALPLDVTLGPWPVATFDAVVCINMIHIAPWAATPALFAGAAQVLGPTGQVILYGPYRIDGHTAPSNLVFEQWLHDKDPGYGVRELREVETVAAAAGFVRAELVAMPANNHVVVFARR